MKISALSTHRRSLVWVALLALASGCCEHAGPPMDIEVPPTTVDAGPDQTVQVGDVVTLAGANNGNTGSHKWQFFSTPVESATSIDDHLVLDGASFVADMAGTYEIELIGAFSSSPDAPDVNPAAKDTVLITAVEELPVTPPPPPPVGACEGAAVLTESFDGGFDPSSWTEWGPFIVPPNVPGGDVGASHGTDGGNPGGHLRFGIQGVSVPRGESTTVWGHLVSDQAVHDPASRGAIGRIDFSFDGRLPPGGLGNRAVTLAVEQDGFLWFALDKRVFIGDLGWMPMSIPHLQASDFTSLLIDEPGQPEHPDFSDEGSPIYFGLSQGNHCPTASDCSLPPSFVEVDIDNVRVDICPGGAGECGDGIVSLGEDCDDANDVRGDGCHRCASEQECVVTHNSGRPASFGSVRVDQALNVTINPTATLPPGQDDDDPEDYDENSFGRLATCGTEHAYAVLKEAGSLARLTFDDQGTPQFVDTTDIPGLAAVVCAPSIGVLYAVAASQPGPILDVYSFVVEEDGSLSEADGLAVTFLEFLNFGFDTARVATHPTTGDLWVTGYFDDAFGGGGRSTTARIQSSVDGALSLAEPVVDIGTGGSGSSFRFSANGRSLAASGVDGDCTAVWQVSAEGDLPTTGDQQRACGYLWESGDVAWFRDTDQFHYILLEELNVGGLDAGGALNAVAGSLAHTRARLMESLYDSSVVVTVSQSSGRLTPFAIGEDPADVTSALRVDIAERGIRSLAKVPCIP
jgi:cysteine-rich repeat protein